MFSKFKQSLTAQIVLGMLLGAFWGIFFGESSMLWAPLGKAFIMLLQMPVIIFLVTSIITGIGQLSIRNAKTIFFYTLVFLVGSWTITQSAIYFLPMGFPPIKAIEKYAAATLNAPLSRGSLISYFIPENPFKAFSEGTIPAIVIFSFLLAFALLMVKKREPFLDNLKILQKSSLTLVSWFTKLSPFGIFALTASTAGVRRLVEFQEIQYYYYSYIFGALFVSIVLVPLLSSVFLPFSYGEIISPLKPALLVALSTGSVLVTLPIIIEEMDKKTKKYNYSLNESEGLSKTITPLIYNFPISGKLINIIFIFYVAWHYNVNISPPQALELSLLGILTSFGSTNDALVFLLDSLSLPLDSLNLFISSMVITSRFSAMARVASIATLCYFTISSLEGRLGFNLKRMALFLVVLVLGFGGWFMALETFGKPIISSDKSFEDLTISNGLAAETLDIKDVTPRNMLEQGGNIFPQIRKSGELRVGIIPERIPFVYHNIHNELVGFDIESAHNLAKELDVSLKFVFIEEKNIKNYLNKGIVDIVMSGIFLKSDILLDTNTSNPYLEESHVFVVLDKYKKKFESFDDVFNSKSSIAVVKSSIFPQEASKYFPRKQKVFLHKYDEFITNKQAEVLLWVMPQALTWTMVNPQFSVVQDNKLERVSYVYIVADNNDDFLAVINRWVRLKSSHNFFKRLYNKWVLNKEKSYKKRRWSIWQDIIKKFEDDA